MTGMHVTAWQRQWVATRAAAGVGGGPLALAKQTSSKLQKLSIWMSFLLRILCSRELYLEIFSILVIIAFLTKRREEQLKIMEQALYGLNAT